MTLSKKAGAEVVKTEQGLRNSQHARFQALSQLAMLAGSLGAGTAGAMALPQILDSTPDETLEEPQDNYVTIGNVQPKRLVHKYPLPKVAQDQSIGNQVAAGPISNLQSRLAEAISKGMGGLNLQAPPAGSVGKNLQPPGNIVANAIGGIKDMASRGMAALGPIKDRVVEAITPAEDNAGPFTGVAGPTLAAGAIGIPAYLGYKGVRSLLDRYSQDSREAELAEAKRKFEKARAAQYAQMLQQKSGLDNVYANRETVKATLAKSAEGGALNNDFDFMNIFSNLYGKPIGAVTGMPDKEAWKSYIGTVLAGSAVAGVGGYALGKNMTSRTTREQLKKKILKQRAAARANTSYSALPATYAAPAEPRTMKLAARTSSVR